MLDKEFCEQLIRNGSTKSPLAVMYNVDFRIKNYTYNIDPNCANHIENVLGHFEKDKTESYAYLFNNVAATQKIVLEVIK